jgi:protein-S-isoprenylcysteine O-methyltransferase Ste14
VNDTEDRGPDVRLHPPVIYGISILCGIGLAQLHALPMPFGLNQHIHGGIIITCAIALALWALLQFFREGTEVRPDRPDSVLLTGGPYRFSRNPLYVVLTLVQITAAIWLDNLWILLLTPLSVVVITRYAISREERYLERLFGAEYLAYKRRVRRWL